MANNRITPTAFFACALLLIALHATAQQKATLSGYVYAAEKPLAGASVIITRLKDSTKLSSRVTNDDGSFTISSLPQKDSLKIEISFVGYIPFKGLLIITGKNFSMAAITLQPVSAGMDTVVVKAERLVRVKGDTIEFRASAIKTPPNSMAEELLKRVPGLQIGRDGKLTYNGRPVTKILVDGKPFFSQDGAVALANIPAEMIDKIQVANDSTQAGVRKEEGDLNHTLNLKLKSGLKFSANSYVAAGTNERYDGAAFASRISDKKRISLNLGSNNINKIALNNGGLQVFNNGSGIIRTTLGGVDYGNTFGSGGSLNASYTFDLPYTFRETLKQRKEDILPSTVFLTSSGQTSENKSYNQQLNMAYEKKTVTKAIYVYGLFNYSNIDNLTVSNASTADGQMNLLNALQGNSVSKGNTWKANLGISGQNTFNKKGAQLRWNISYNSTGTNLMDRNDVLTLFYKNNVIDSQFRFRQEMENNAKTHTALLYLRHQLPLGKHTSVVLEDALAYGWNSSGKTTWNNDSLGNKVQVDSAYSNYFKSNFLDNASIVSFVYTDGSWKLTLGCSVLQNYSTQRDFSTNKTIAQNNLIPTLNTTIKRTTKKQSWMLRSSADRTLPTITQLQPVANISNPLNIIIGNPQLRPQISYDNVFRWNNKKVQINGRPLATLNSLDLNYYTVHDKIVASVEYDSLGKQTTSFQNVNGTYNAQGILQLSMQKKSGINYMTLGMRSAIIYSRDKTFINGSLYSNHTITSAPAVYFTYRHSDVISLLVRYAPSWNHLTYEQNKALDKNFSIQTFNSNLDLYIFKKIKISQAFDYIYNKSLPAGFKKTSVLWNAGTSVTCLKNKKGEISFTAFDILKQFNNLSRTVRSNYIEDTQSNNLQRYVMLGLKYFFNKIEKPEN